MKTQDIAKALQERKDRSAWSKGVTVYALEMTEEAQAAGYEELTPKECKAVLLNGAADWKQYSYGGCSLIYDEDIARRVCTPSELKRKHNGRAQPRRCNACMVRRVRRDVRRKHDDADGQRLILPRLLRSLELLARNAARLARAVSLKRIGRRYDARRPQTQGGKRNESRYKYRNGQRNGPIRRTEVLRIL